MSDAIVRLRVESNEYNNKLKQATQDLQRMGQECRKVGGTLAILDKEQLEFVKGLGNMETKATSARGKIREMTQSFTEWSLIYKRMTDEEKNGDMGKYLSAGMEQLKVRINEAKTELADVDRELSDASTATNDWSGVLNQLGSQLGINTNLLSGLTTGTIATTAAVTTGVTAVAAATKAWADYNDEMNRQNTMTKVVTGGKGDEDLTVGVRALARTYDVDFRQAIEAANTLMQQFGVTSGEALQLLQDGMQGMIAGDGGKLLSMIQQYAPSFRDAGIEASQLVAIIQNSEGGLFTDQNMSAIVMGIRNIRLMTEQTSKALAQLGIDGEEMTRKLNEGSMTIFEAMQQVSTAIENAGSSSQSVGQVMQQVFGRQGTAAGTNLAKAIETLNTNLQETKTQTGELGESFVKLNEANLRLETTMQEIFGMSGWEDMNNLLKTDLANTLSDVLEIIGGIRDSIKEIGTLDGFEKLAETINKATGGLLAVNGQLRTIQNILAFIKGLKGGEGNGTLSGIGQGIAGQIGGVVSAAKGNQQNGFSITTDSNGNVIKATRDGKDVTNEYLNGTTTTPIVTNPVTPKGVGGRNGTPWTPIAMGDFTGLDITGRSVNDVTSEIQRAQAKFNAAGDEIGRAMAKAMIEALQKEKDTMMNEGDVTKGGFSDAYNHDFSKDIKKLDSQMKSGKNLAEQGKEVSESWREAAGAIGSVGNALAGLEDPGARIAGTVGQAIAQIALGFAQATAKTGGTTGVFGWIAAIAGGMATMLSTISAIHSATGYATGGIVKGPSGVDAVPAMLTAGEVVLNHAQQTRLANELQANEQRGGGGGSAPSYVKGEDIFLGVNNYLRRSGRGELVTSRR